MSEVSIYLGVKPSTIYAWAKVGEIPHFKIGKMLRFKKSEIDVFMENHRGNVIDTDTKAKEILKKVRSPKIDVDSIVKKAVEEAKSLKYTPGYGKSDRIRGLRKEVSNGTL